MVNKKEIQEYIKSIPPKPDVVNRTIKEVEKKELKKASNIAKEDIVLVKYMQNLINKPIFGLRNKVEDLTQIFAILGTDAVYELLHHYLLTLLSPKEWRVFKLNESLFAELQANLSFYWGKILEYEKVEDKNISSAISLLPVTIIVCDELFYSSKNELEILSESSIIDYDFMLFKLTGIHLNSLSIRIGKYWGYSPTALNIIRVSSKNKNEKDYNPQIVRLGQWMHLLLFYVLSKPVFITSELNSFIKFDIDYVQPVYQDFEKALGEFF